MAEEKLREIINDALSGQTLNTNEVADKIRDACTSAHTDSANKLSEQNFVTLNNPVDDFNLRRMEYAWRLLEPFYNQEHSYKSIERACHPGDSPLSSFFYYVGMGFYPPPEIIIALAISFQKYEDAGGDISLDEAFHGVSHKKRSSKAYQNEKAIRYGSFHHNVQQHGDVDKGKKSLAEIAEVHLSGSAFSADRDIDVESFLRGYRRWMEMEQGRK